MARVNSYIFNYTINEYDGYGHIWRTEQKRLLLYSTDKKDALNMFRAWSNKHRGLIEITLNDVKKDNKQGYEANKTIEYIQKQKDFINAMADVYTI